MRIRTLSLVLLACATASAASAQYRKPNTHTARFCIDLDVVRKAWPEAAKAKGQEGLAVVRCLAKVSNRLEACVVESETPTGLGFGSAALGVVKGTPIEAALIDGVAQDSVVRIRIPFDDKGATLINLANPRSPPVFTDVAWSGAPTLKALKSAYPPTAWRLGEDGFARLLCTVTASGAATDCVINSESPSMEYGFGKAALKLAGQFQVMPQTQSGRPTAGAKISFLVRFPRSLEKGSLDKSSLLILARPAPSDITRQFPIEAGNQREGYVTLICQVGRTGRAEDCTAKPRTPNDAVFAPAALALAPLYEFSLWDDGVPSVGVMTELPIYFHKPEAKA